MGEINFNRRGLHPELLNNECIICNNPGFTPIFQNPQIDCFEYCCNHCNPNVIIVLTGSFLADVAYENLAKNPQLREIHFKRLQKMNDGVYAISTESD